MRQLTLAGLAAALILALPGGQVAAEAPEAAEDGVYAQLELFGDIFERIRARYVDEVSDEELIRAAIDGMLASLDPHSSYLPPDEYARLRSQTSGAFGGVGIEVSDEAGRVRIVRTTAGAPAERAGLRAGDIITHLDGEPTDGLTLRETSDRIRGDVGSVVTLTVMREGAEGALELAVTRESIRSRTVTGTLEDGVVVLKISTFNQQTFPMLEEAFDEQVAAAGGIGAVAGVLVDLRDNRGGLLDQAVKVSDAFLDRGAIVSTRGRDAGRTAAYSARPGDLAAGKPVVVLINGRSASASEIVAGALQDHGRALVVGTQSFGKGSVQTIMVVPMRGAMKLTTSRYYTPSGRSIQSLGIAPDLVIEQREADDGRAGEGAASDYQLGYALDIVRGLALLRPAPAGRPNDERHAEGRRTASTF